MKIDIYQSTKDHTKFLSVQENTDVESLHMSAEEARLYQEVAPFKKGLTIQANDKRIAMNTEEIIAQIERKGYALHGAKIEFNEVS